MSVGRLLRSLTFWVVVGGVAGYLVALYVDSSTGSALHQSAITLKQFFINLLRMLIGPVVFFSLIGSIVRTREKGLFQRLTVITALYFIITTALSIGLGLGAGFLFQPGTQIELAVEATEFDEINPELSVTSTLVNGVLASAVDNPFKALVETNILALVFNAFLLGLALRTVLPHNSPVHTGIEHVNLGVNKVLSWGRTTRA